MLNEKEEVMCKEEVITEQDLASIRFFWEEKEDVERWIQWKDKLPLLREQHPELVDAVERYRIAKLTLSAVVKGVCT